MRLVDATTMRALDSCAIERFGIPGIILMENAGLATASVILNLLPERRLARICVLCGRGNNGGDGLVIARHLHNAGCSVQILLFGVQAELKGDAAANLSIAQNMGLALTEVLTPGDWEKHQGQALSAQLIVDAMLGTGLSDDVAGVMRMAIAAINSSPARVVSVDIPSGLDASSGHPLGIAVRAEVTVTYGLAKLGQVLEIAQPYVGTLRVVDISLPREIVRQTSDHDRLLEAEEIAAVLPSRPVTGHKGSFGHVLIVAGSRGKIGAAMLAAHAAIRSGVGLVTLAIPASTRGELRNLWPEIMLEAVHDSGRGHFSAESLAPLLELIRTRDALALGPGLSTGSEVQSMVFGLLEGSCLPVAVDADALNVVAGKLDRFAALKMSRLITPHPGEAARLLEQTVNEINSDRTYSAKQLALRSGSIAVLKGARTLIARPDGRISVNPTGNPGMATGGSGDVLTGLVGGLLAQGMSPEDAACAAVYVHGLAGDLASINIGGRAMIASDLIAHLGQAFQCLLGPGA